MRRCLVDLLACPECRGSMEIAEVREENAVRILQGALRCVACSRRYPVEKGVPRLVKAADDVAEVCKRFSFQWLSRWNGAFESRERCYGFHDDVYIGWVKEQLECRRKPEPGDWLLDCGCGSGEKTAVLARHCPGQNVVGLDLGVESLEKATAKFGGMTNLDYVQGNLLEPPFKDRQFHAGMSLGVLHHTPNTREAFASFRRLLKEETTCVIWIYPTYWEGPEWRMPYIGRDVMTLGQGYRLPTRLLRMIAHGMVIGFYPVVQFFFKKCYRRIGRDLPFFRVDSMTRGERYNAQVFYCFDTMLPRYQGRHKIKEVEGWMVEEGLDPVSHAHSFFTGSSVPVRVAPPSRPAERAVAGAAS
ncbi:MAG: methyltransferase domain-containing protein [Gemmataceae bacterium]